jgi:hypothetical protein
MQPAPLSQDELLQLEALEAEEAQLAGTAPESGPTTGIDPREAELGIMRRAQYALEPLESNRRAFLIEEYGAENVMQDENGDLFVRQQGMFRPVNEPGFSAADVANFIGATPEMLGAGAGALLGMGAGSIPSAMVGGAAGSALRQGVSAAIGTPQVAGLKERAFETGVSALTSGAGAGVGKVLKGAGKGAVEQISKRIPGFAKSEIGENMAKIATEEGVPALTPSQVAGGDDLIAEKILQARRFFGRGLRQHTKKQVEAIKKNLSEGFGEFVETESDSFASGLRVKDLAERNIKTIKTTASKLYDEIDKEGAEILLPTRPLRRSLIDKFSQKGFFNSRGKALPYSSKTGLTRDQYKRVQSVYGGILDDIKNSGDMIDFKSVNTMRKTIDANIKEVGKMDGGDIPLLELRKDFMEGAEQMLSGKSPDLSNKFKEANSLWKSYLDKSNLYRNSGGKGLGLAEIDNARVLKQAFSNARRVEQLKEVIGENATRSAGVAYINGLLSKNLGKEGSIGARTLLNKITGENTEAIRRAIGRTQYKKLVNNLKLLDRIGEPINPSKTAITQLMADISVKNLVSGVGDVALAKARNLKLKAPQLADELLESVPMRSAGLAGLLADPKQREMSYKSRSRKK